MSHTAAAVQQPAPPAQLRLRDDCPMIFWGQQRRHAHIRGVVERTRAEVGDRPIAIYGAGKHTRTLMQVISACSPKLTVAFIIDDFAETSNRFDGVPVLKPERAAPADVAAVIVSSDSIEERLTQRAQMWAASAPASRDVTPVVRIYGAELLSREAKALTDYDGAWGFGEHRTKDHMPMRPDDLVLKLPAAPDRVASTLMPLPPPVLRAGYSPDDDDFYLAGGKRDTDSIRELVSRIAPEAANPSRVLDWGCSTGRIIRHWTDVVERGGEVWGADICHTAVNWASENLSPPFRFVRCSTRPHLPFADGTFDMIYANSVFTHIRDEWDAWLMELRRILRPGGVVFASILDETAWERCMKNPTDKIREYRPELDFSKPMTGDFAAHGTGFDIVSFWHSRGVRRRWSFAFEVLACEPGTIPSQTGCLLRKN